MTANAAGDSRQSTAERPLRVLLAESSQRARERMTAILTDQAFEVVTAEDGFDVLCRLPELRPDLLLMATSLPRLDGIQVCSLVRQCPDFKTLTVVLMNDEQHLLDEVRAEMAGADSCLHTPFQLAELQRALISVQQREQTTQAAVA